MEENKLSASIKPSEESNSLKKVSDNWYKWFFSLDERTGNIALMRLGISIKFSYPLSI